MKTSNLRFPMIGRPLYNKSGRLSPSQHVRWQSFKLVCNTDQRWLWARLTEIEGRGLSVTSKLLEFLLREAGGR